MVPFMHMDDRRKIRENYVCAFSLARLLTADLAPIMQLNLPEESVGDVEQTLLFLIFFNEVEKLLNRSTSLKEKERTKKKKNNCFWRGFLHHSYYLNWVKTVNFTETCSSLVCVIVVNFMCSTTASQQSTIGVSLFYKALILFSL